MEMFDMNTANGSNTGNYFTITSGPSTVGLITFAAIYWGSLATLQLIAIVLYLIREPWERLGVTVLCIGVVVTVTAAILLAVGIVLCTQDGLPSFTHYKQQMLMSEDDSTGLSSAGITGRVLLILSEVFSLLIWLLLMFVLFAEIVDLDQGIQNSEECGVSSCVTCGLMVTPVIGVVLLGLSSFQFEENGSEWTNLSIAAVVFSSLGVSVPLFAALGICLKGALCIPGLIRDVWSTRLDTKETLETRLRKSKSLLEEALKRGFEECRTVVCLLVGVAGVGKTHTKHLLLRFPPPESRNSTPLAARPIQATHVQASTQGGQLQEVKPDQLDEILADAVAKGVPLERESFFPSLFCYKCNCYYNQTTSAGISPSSEQQQSISSSLSANPCSYGAIESPSSESTSHTERKYCCCCPIIYRQDSDTEQITKAALSKTIHQIANTVQSQQPLSGDWIYLIDSGGQIEFFEVLPAFLQHISVCLFVTKLSEMLSECPKIEYFENGNPLGKPTLCPFTNEQMLMRCVQTINDSSTNQDSKLVMVGTHLDDAHKCLLESIGEKNQRLKSKLHPDFNRSLVFRGQEIIFPINAKNPGPQDHEVASEIKKVIFDVASDLEPRRTPISWFKLEQIIQKLVRDRGKKILRWEECFEVARLLHLSKKDLNAALDHLASFGVIHYYPHLLPDVVFVDPQFILENISEVVKFHYKLRCGQHSHTAIRGEWRKFISEACITLELLRKEELSKHYTNFFTAAEFLQLMKDRLIVTDLIGKDEYFMPCLLKTMEPHEVDQYRVSTPGVAPLAIHFSCKLVPHGVFCSLVAFLRSSQNSSPWSLFPHPDNTTEPQCLTRNCIKFKSPKDAPGSLTLIDAFSHFEVYVQARHDTYVHLCPSIWQTLVEGLQKAAETLKYQLVPKQAFLCEHDNTRPHLALLAEEPLNYWTCELNPDTSGPLKEQHKVWHPKKVGLGMQAPTAEAPVVLSEVVEVPQEKVQLPLETHYGGETVGQQRRREHKNLKWFVMFIIAILGLVVSIVGIIVSVINH